MSRRNKSRPRGAQPNTEAVSVQDAFSNPLFRLGYGSQSPLEATEYPLTRMTDNYALLNSLYRDNWVVQNVVGIIPDDMTKKWFAPAGAVGPEHLKELDRVQRVTGAPGAGQRGTAVGQAVRRRRRTYHDPRTGGDAGPATGAGEHLPRYLPRALHTRPLAGRGTRYGAGIRGRRAGARLLLHHRRQGEHGGEGAPLKAGAVHRPRPALPGAGGGAVLGRVRGGGPIQ